MIRIDSDVTLGDRYRLRRRIAAGGMGSVWEAEDTLLDRRVAIKVPSEALVQDERFVERFRREARAAAGLSHPNVAAVLDYGEEDGTPFIVMELLKGETLAERLQHGPLSLEETAWITEQVAAALDAAHAAGIVHRDVKPANVMLTGDGSVKVMDFGIAAASGASRITATGATIGTAAYLSPEQAAGQPVTPASDVYSLGVVVYEMLAGQPPFVAETPVAVVAAHVGATPPPLRDAAPHVPEHAAAAVEQALAKDPAKRPPSASAFAAQLGSAGPAVAPVGAVGPEGQTEVLTPPSSTSVLPTVGAAPAPGRRAPSRQPPGRRRWGWVLLAALLGLGLLGSVLASAFLLPGDRPQQKRRQSPTPQQIEFPNVIGIPIEDAQDVLAQEGFDDIEVVPTEGPEDIVVDSDPQPEANVDIGSPVTLYVGAPGDDDNSGQGGGNGGGKGKGQGGGGDD